MQMRDGPARAIGDEKRQKMLLFRMGQFRKGRAFAIPDQRLVIARGLSS